MSRIEVHFSMVGTRHAAAYKPEQLIRFLAAVPREGETVRMRYGLPLRVCRVAHYPEGTDECPGSFVSVELEDED